MTPPNMFIIRQRLFDNRDSSNSVKLRRFDIHKHRESIKKEGLLGNANKKTSTEEEDNEESKASKK